MHPALRSCPHEQGVNCELSTCRRSSGGDCPFLLSELNRRVAAEMMMYKCRVVAD